MRGLLILLLTACSSTPVVRPPPLVEAPVTVLRGPKPQVVWERQLEGLITDLAISGQGSALVAATVAHPDAPVASNGPILWKWSSQGQLHFRKDLPAPLKALAISQDGALVAASTYNDHLAVYDQRGHEIWSIEEACQPIWVTAGLLCFHDDDAEPRIAFEAYNRKGKRIKRVTLSENQRDLLFLKTSPHGQATTLGFTGGEFFVFDQKLKQISRSKLGVEITDLDVDDQGGVWVLADGLLRSQTKGRPIEVKVDPSVEQIELGDRICALGNSTPGQWGACYSSKNGNLLWKFQNPLVAEHQPRIQSTESLDWISVEDPDPALFAYSKEGHLAWDFHLDHAENAVNIQSFAASDLGSVLILATDDGKLIFLKALKPI